MTSTTAAGYAQDIVAISRGQDATSYVPTYASNLPALTTKTHRYGEFLPNVDYKLTLARNRFLANDSLLLRLSWAKSLTRPDLTQIAPSLSLNLPRPNFLNGSGGNVDLKPYTADNYDLGLEYYFSRIDYLSVDGFYKDIRDFITQGNVTSCFTIQNPSNISDGNISGSQACYAILQPNNTSTANLYGVELDAQYGFDFLPSPFDGLGVIANLTYVRSSAAYNPAILNQVFAIPGLSNTRNYTLFYSKGPIEARVAYSWRGKFYEQPAGFGIEPRFDDPYDTVDAQVSYDFSGLLHQDVKLVLQGTNITNSKLLKSGRYDDQFAHLEWAGPTYTVQVLARF
jgi:TonB-dependent receptor